MKKGFKNVIMLVLCFAITISQNIVSFAATSTSLTTAKQVVADMKIGWNLGNSLDCYNWNRSTTTNYETIWGNPVTTQAMIDKVKAAGFKAVRIPITYYDHMNANGTINSAWLARIATVINYVLNDDMYCIIDVHHDTSSGGWIHADTDTYTTDSTNLTNIWTQVSTYFKNYGNKLLFECTNEIINNDNCWNWGTKWADFRKVHDLNQSFITLVRKSGGNNASRFLVVSTFGASSDACEIEQDFYKSYTDTASDKLILSVHNYSYDASTVSQTMSSLASYSTKYNIPIIIDEFGTQSTLSTASRASYASNFVGTAQKSGITCFWWDDNGKYQLLNRTTLNWAYPSIVSALMSASGVSSTASTNLVTELNYIESSSTYANYFDTGIYANNNTSVKMDMSLSTTTNYGDFFDGGTYVFRQEAASGLFERFGWYNGCVYKPSANERFTIYQDKNKTYINSILVRTATNQTITSSYSAKIGKAKMRLYSCQIYSNGTLVKNYIPVLDQNKKVVLYDKVNGTFTYPTGTFTYSAK